MEFFGRTILKDFKGMHRTERPEVGGEGEREEGVGAGGGQRWKRGGGEREKDTERLEVEVGEGRGRAGGRVEGAERRAAPFSPGQQERAAGTLQLLAGAADRCALSMPEPQSSHARTLPA